MATATDNKRDNREYTATHPWITFFLDVSNMPWTYWDHVGEARSKCRHLSRTPLPPDLARNMERVYLAKGAKATTAIEGNSLSEEQVLAAVDGNLELPQSQKYLQQEVENILKAIWGIEREIYAGSVFQITPERLCDLNGKVLEGLEVEDHVTPGEFRTTGVVVGGVYRGAPAADCAHLVDRMCDWLDGVGFIASEEGQGNEPAFTLALLKAVVAHVYIAWIHPFGDGNGRTARLVEFGILTAAGIPSVAAHLLSNHYNATRQRYYRELEHASKSGGDLTRFLDYAVEGFVGELQQQLDGVHGWIVEAAWTNHVQAIFAEMHTATRRRQRDLVLALPADTFAPSKDLDTNAAASRGVCGKAGKDDHTRPQRAKQARSHRTYTKRDQGQARDHALSASKSGTGLGER